MRLTPAFATCSHSQLARIRNLAAFATWLHDPDDSVLPAYRPESVMQAVGPLTASTNQGVKDFFFNITERPNTFLPFLPDLGWRPLVIFAYRESSKSLF